MAYPPPRRRSGPPSWAEPIIERLTPTIKALVLVNVVVYVFYVFARPARSFMVAHLGLGPGLFAGEIWQPVTALFFHTSLLFVLNIIGLWFVGAALEKMRGTRPFLALFLGSGVLANLAIAGVSHLRAFEADQIRTEGCSYAVLALFVAFGRLLGRQQTRVLWNLFMPARTLAMVFVGLALLISLAQGDFGGVAGVLVASGAGYLGGGPGGLRELWLTLKSRRLRRRYRVYEGGRERPSKKYMN
jgi:membrane associated rhomboid family serine protease